MPVRAVTIRVGESRRATHSSSRQWNAIYDLRFTIYERLKVPACLAGGAKNAGEVRGMILDLVSDERSW
jgi:hypothetical protein